MYEISAKPLQIVIGYNHFNLNPSGREKLVAIGTAFYPFFIFVDLHVAGQCVHAGLGLPNLSKMSPPIYPCFTHTRQTLVTFSCQTCGHFDLGY